MNKHDIFILVIIAIIALMGSACIMSILVVLYALVKNIWLSIALTIPVMAVITFALFWWFDHRIVVNNNNVNNKKK